MAIVNDDMNEDSAHSSIVDSLNFNLGEDAPSPNDLAWADSCLNGDLAASNADCDSIKDALLEILSSHSGRVDPVDLNFRDYAANLTFGTGYDDDDDLIDDSIGDTETIELSDDDEDDLIIGNRRGESRGKRRIENVFRPNYTEDTVKVDSNDTGMDLSLTTWELGSSSEDIFKVWDLGISEEQDDFTKQLEKVFVDFPLPIQPNLDDSTAWKDVTHVSVDDLIAGMGDLSLKRNSS